MKKLVILSLTFLFLSNTSTFAQCTPDASITTPGYYPEIFDDAVVGESYKQVLQIRVIKDTNVIYNGLPVTAKIDSINLIKIIGLPANFDYTCYNATCSYVPTETGCAVLEGTAAESDIGIHPLDLVVKVYAKVFTVRLEEDDTIRDRFAFSVTRTGGYEIVDLSAQPKFYPNPSTSGVFELDKKDWMNSEIEVYNQYGQMCYKSQLQSNVLDLSTLPEGLYTYMLTNKNDLQTVGRLMSLRH
jgi:hypothetical protein